MVIYSGVHQRDPAPMILGAVTLGMAGGRCGFVKYLFVYFLNLRDNYTNIVRMQMIFSRESSKCNLNLCYCIDSVLHN